MGQPTSAGSDHLLKKGPRRDSDTRKPSWMHPLHTIQCESGRSMLYLCACTYKGPGGALSSDQDPEKVRPWWSNIYMCVTV
jgi:hypothetical protein